MSRQIVLITILHLAHVRRAKRAVIEDLRRQPACFRGDNMKALRAFGQIMNGKLKPDSEDELEQTLDFINATPPEDTADLANAESTLASILAQAPKELRRMAEYERRGISRRGRALRRLSYERIEAERRRQRS